jgi:hypothetical protein
MPPVARGDLYRARLLGFGMFLILDGVFLEQLAVSPREIIDVLRDGATVLGAASMGAIRAAECWPAGMRGIGSIYRLYRRGALMSDDEVAVTFSPACPFPAATVALVNVRYAAGRAWRDGLLTRDEVASVVNAACELHFTDRQWHSILGSAGLCDADGRRVSALLKHDLKALDGLRAIKALQALEELATTAPAPSRVLPSTLTSVLRVREPVRPDVANRLGAKDAPVLWQWLITTGRYRRYLSSGAVGPRHRRLVDPNTKSTRNGDRGLADEADSCIERSADATPWLRMKKKAVSAAVARGRSSAPLLAALMAREQMFGQAVWAEISAQGDTEAVVLRFVAQRGAIDRARSRSLAADARDRHLARVEIANNHGFRTWLALQNALSCDESVLRAVDRAGEELALAKRVRRELFGGRGVRLTAPDDRGIR